MKGFETKLLPLRFAKGPLKDRVTPLGFMQLIDDRA